MFYTFLEHFYSLYKYNYMDPFHDFDPPHPLPVIDIRRAVTDHAGNGSRLVDAEAASFNIIVNYRSSRG